MFGKRDLAEIAFDKNIFAEGNVENYFRVRRIEFVKIYIINRRLQAFFGVPDVNFRVMRKPAQIFARKTDSMRARWKS